MFVPGNNPGMMQDAYIYRPDSIMLDLEDSVTMAEKDAARLLVYNALKTIDYGTTEMVVRINPLNTPYGKKDIEAVVKAGVHVIRMPKTETAEEVVEVEREIEKVEREIGCLGRTQIMAAIESTLGVVNAYAIATASKRMMGIALGAEDYCANLKTQRSPEGMELLMARQTIVVAARAAGIDALDTVYSNLNDMETFRKEVELIHQLGFDGKSIINPRQIEIINEVFTPTQKAIDKARRQKQSYAKKATKYQYYEMANKIDNYLFAIVSDHFDREVLPLIEDEKPLREINQAVYDKVIVPVMEELNTVGDSDTCLCYTLDDVFGMLYYLTGNCHINWAIYDV